MEPKVNIEEIPQTVAPALEQPQYSLFEPVWLLSRNRENNQKGEFLLAYIVGIKAHWTQKQGLYNREGPLPVWTYTVRTLTDQGRPGPMEVDAEPDTLITAAYSKEEIMIMLNNE